MADSQKYASTNIFDIDNPNILNGYIDSNDNYIPYATNGTLYVPITAGTSYTVSGIIRASQSAVVRIATFTAIPSTQMQSVNLYTLNQGDSITITTSNNENYLLVMFCGDSDYTAYGSVQAALMANCANLHIDAYDWRHSLRKFTTAAEIVENPLYSDGTAITAYTIKGNTTQSGTPTPSAPISVNGVGNKTANLLFAKKEGYNLASNGRMTQASGYNMWFAEVTAGETYVAQNVNGTYGFYNTNPYTGTDVVTYDGSRVTFSGSQPVITIPQGVTYIGIRALSDTTNVMINEGSTAKPYEPYGYKIPISTLQGSAVNYLGSVQSERQIGKYEFTGTEVITKLNSSADNYAYYYTTNGVAVGGLECTHLQYLTSGISTTVGISQNRTYPNTWYMNVGADIMNAQPSGNTVEGFKEWLAAQYAAATPVTVWYIKQTATTGQVNEPLMKIGDYADSISNATAIPTTEGANSITVDTTVQPSEFSATWTGWHDSSVKEYDGSDWQ